MVVANDRREVADLLDRLVLPDQASGQSLEIEPQISASCEIVYPVIEVETVAVDGDTP
jgi:hypothetical protein